MTIYCFGSYLVRNDARDIDLAIIHSDLTAGSIRLALDCKRWLQTHVTQSHTTILSIAENLESSFLEVASAKRLGTVSTDTMSSDLLGLVSQLHASSFRE